MHVLLRCHSSCSPLTSGAHWQVEREVDSAFRQAKELQESVRLQHLCGFACVAVQELRCLGLSRYLHLVFNTAQKWRARRWSQSGAAGVCRGKGPHSSVLSRLKQALA